MKFILQVVAVLSLLSAIHLKAQSQPLPQEAFTKIKAKNFHGTLHLTQGDIHEIAFEGPVDALKNIETKISKGKLVIWSKKDDSSQLEEIHLFITASEFTHISLAGSGNIVTKNQLTSKRIELSHSGTGTMTIVCEASELIVSQSGKGTIHLKGSTDKLTLSKSGAGDLFARELTVEKCSVGNSGSGICEVLCPYSF